ncbi:MAG TPA: DUF2934 domain-containing protein [Terracidiphilus sp.]|nr:DUF2934 domain-containing protein [Terracidiphilus sp.]
MEEAGKKAAAPKKAAKKTTKAAAHAAPAPVAAKAMKRPVAVKAKAAPTKKTANGAAAKPKITHEAIAMLAHRYWAERGGHHGRHEDDWYRAEQALLGKAS